MKLDSSFCSFFNCLVSKIYDKAQIKLIWV
uniref:Uncharacterized protein n=1 Tax=Arundo donax TaxID=35708 RepID=A0A0A8ZQY8_ARUDO